MSQIHSFANKRRHFKIKHTSLFVNFVLGAFPDHLVVACDLSFRLLGRRGPGEGSGNGFERVSSSAGFLQNPGWNGVDGGVRYFGDSDSCRRGDWSTRGFRPTLGLAEMEGDERDAAEVSRTIQPLSSALEDFFKECREKAQ